MSSPASRNRNRNRERFFMDFNYPLTGATASAVIAFAASATGADGDTLTLNDGFRKVTYEYDKSSNGVTAGNVQITVGTTAASVATLFAAAITANQPAFLVTDDLAGNLTIRHRVPGLIGNNAWTKTGAIVATAAAAFAGGLDPAGSVFANTAIKLHTVVTNGRAYRIERAYLNLPAGLAGNASNYCTFQLKNGSAVAASWSTLNSAQSTITADTAAEMVLSTTQSDKDAVDGAVLSLALVMTGTPTVPPGRIVIEGLIL